MKTAPPFGFSIAVYCGSRMGQDSAFSRAAAQVGDWIGRHQGRLVYGGGNNGLMGVVANATLAAGGQVLGVIPQALVDKEVAKRDCTELVVVNTMHERKALMAENADAFLVLPGGIGTLEEMFEVWAWRQLGYHDKPIGLLNVNGCYDGLLQFLAQNTELGFMSAPQHRLLQVDTEAAQLLAHLVTTAGLAATRPDFRTAL